MMINYTMESIQRNGCRPHELCTPLPARAQAVADRCDLPWRDAGCRVRKEVKVAPHRCKVQRYRTMIHGESVKIEIRK